MNLKVGDIVVIPQDRPGPKFGRLKSIAYNQEAPELSRCVVDREFSSIHGIRLGDLKPFKTDLMGG